MARAMGEASLKRDYGEVTQRGEGQGGLRVSRTQGTLVKSEGGKD